MTCGNVFKRLISKENCELNENFVVTTLLSVGYQGVFYLHGLTLIPVWISNYMPSKLWDEFTY